MRVRAADLVGPLHLLCLNDQATNLRLAVLCRREGDDEVRSLPISVKF